MSGMTEFIADLPIEICKRRLESRHQNFTFFAWRGQTRVAVKVIPIDTDTYKFRLKRVSKSSPFEWGSSGGFHGYLRRLTNNSTAVVGQKQINWISIIFAQILMVVMSVFIIGAGLSDATFSTDDFPLLVGGAFVINILIFTVAYVYGAGHAKEMENTVTRILGQAYDFGKPLNTPYD